MRLIPEVRVPFDHLGSRVANTGASFATGVASAQFALGISPAKPDFGVADGLTYVEPEGNEVVTVGATSFGAQPCDHDASR